MKIEITEALWLDEGRALSLAELAELSGLSQEELRQLIDYEALPAAENDGAAAPFGAECLAVARTACRLRDDFDLDADALALVLKLLDRINALEAELRALRAQVPQRRP